MTCRKHSVSIYTWVLSNHMCTYIHVSQPWLQEMPVASSLYLFLLPLPLSLFLFIALFTSLFSCPLLLSQSTMSATMQPTRSLCSSHHSPLSLSLTLSLSLSLSLSVTPHLLFL